MLIPLKQFYCDTCGQIINQPEDGWLEWLVAEDGMAHGFRIVHHVLKSPYYDKEDRDKNCYSYDRKLHIQDNHLQRFLGPDGMVILLAKIDPGPITEPIYSGPRVKDVREWVELFRRLTIPHYEEARIHWRRAVDDNYFDSVNSHWIYCQESIKGLISVYSS